MLKTDNTLEGLLRSATDLEATLRRVTDDQYAADSEQVRPDRFQAHPDAPRRPRHCHRRCLRQPAQPVPGVRGAQ